MTDQPYRIPEDNTDWPSLSVRLLETVMVPEGWTPASQAEEFLASTDTADPCFLVGDGHMVHIASPILNEYEWTVCRKVMSEEEGAFFVPTLAYFRAEGYDICPACVARFDERLKQPITSFLHVATHQQMIKLMHAYLLTPQSRAETLQKANKLAETHVAYQSESVRKSWLKYLVNLRFFDHLRIYWLSTVHAGNVRLPDGTVVNLPTQGNKDKIGGIEVSYIELERVIYIHHEPINPLTSWLSLRPLSQS